MVITPIFVVFIILCFVLVFLFVNTIDDRKWLTILISIIVTPFFYFYAFYPLLNIFSSYHHQKYFNAKTWLKQPNFRYEMFDDLQQTDTLIGLSKTEITSLLGTYDWLTWDNAIDDYNEDSWNYGMGIHPGAFNTKSEVMQIIFTASKATKVNTYQLDIKPNAKE